MITMASFSQSSLRLSSFQAFFKVLKKDKRVFERPYFLNNTDQPGNAIDISTIVVSQSKVDKAILFKLKRQENTYVHLTEVTPEQIYLAHIDNWPLFCLRMAIWGYYM